MRLSDVDYLAARVYERERERRRKNAKTRQARWDVGRVMTLSCRVPIKLHHAYMTLCQRSGTTCHERLLQHIQADMLEASHDIDSTLKR